MWNVYEVDIAHRLEPKVLRLTQHTRARTSSEAVDRVLEVQGADAVHLSSHKREVQGELQRLTSPRLRRPCDAIESAEEEARIGGQS